MIIMGITGPTGSGKSYLSKQIKNFFGNNVAIICLDSYYKDQSHLTMAERKKINYDHPDSLDYQLLFEHLNLLKKGKAIEIPTIDYDLCIRKNETITIKPAPIIIIEGILLFHEKNLLNIMDLKIYVNTPLDLCVSRWLLRDTQERGLSCEFNLLRYESVIRPMYKQFIEPYIEKADIKFFSSSNIDNFNSIALKIGEISKICTRKENDMNFIKFENASICEIPNNHPSFFKKIAAPVALSSGLPTLFSPEVQTHCNCTVKSQVDYKLLTLMLCISMAIVGGLIIFSYQYFCSNHSLGEIYNSSNKKRKGR